MTIAGHDVFFALTAPPGQPGCHSLQVAPSTKGVLKYSHFILVQPLGFSCWFDMVLDVTLGKRVPPGASLSEDTGLVHLSQTVASSLNLKLITGFAPPPPHQMMLSAI